MLLRLACLVGPSLNRGNVRAAKLGRVGFRVRELRRHMGAVGCGGKWEPEERAEYLWCSPCSAGEIVLGENDRHFE